MNMNILRIKELLKEKGSTGKELAETIGITETSLSRIVKGDQQPRFELLLQIAETLDVDIKDLFYSTKVNPSKYEYDVVTYDVFEQSNQLQFIKEKSDRGWHLISSVQFIDRDNTPCFRFYFKREI